MTLIRDVSKHGERRGRVRSVRRVSDVEGGSHNHDANYVELAGDTMTGALTLPANPSANLEAATKQYVDNAGSGASFQGAVVDTFESTTATTPSDLTTVGPTFSIDVGASGLLIVAVGAWIRNQTLSEQTYMGFELANTNGQSATVVNAAVWDLDNLNRLSMYAVCPMTGLTAGPTTVTAKYWTASGGTGDFGHRKLAAWTV